jgi:hypothetical protein
MKPVLFLCALLSIVSFAQGQTPSPKLPCDYSGPLLQRRGGKIVLLKSDEMKKRATYEVDLDAPILKLGQLDFFSTVVVEVLVGASGQVVCTKSVSGIPFALEPVERAVRAWTFRPGKQKGKPVAYLGLLHFYLCNGYCREGDSGVTLLK